MDIMDGLIVKEPFATSLVTGLKKYEYRSTPLPKNKTNVKIFILNKGRVLGYVVFYKDVQYNDEDGSGREWHVSENKRFSPYMKYKHKNGCIIWINDVEIFE